MYGDTKETNKDWYHTRWISMRVPFWTRTIYKGTHAKFMGVCVCVFVSIKAHTCTQTQITKKRTHKILFFYYYFALESLQETIFFFWLRFFIKKDYCYYYLQYTISQEYHKRVVHTKHTHTHTGLVQSFNETITFLSFFLLNDAKFFSLLLLLPPACKCFNIWHVFINFFILNLSYYLKGSPTNNIKVDRSLLYRGRMRKRPVAVYKPESFLC